MALVKCAECGNPVSNKAFVCPYCGYAPKGNCTNCKHFERGIFDSFGKCAITEDDFVKKDKGVCPAVIKRFTF